MVEVKGKQKLSSWKGQGKGEGYEYCCGFDSSRTAAGKKKSKSASMFSLVRVAVETFGEGGGDATLHAHVEGGNAALGHRLGEQVEAVYQTFGAVVVDWGVDVHGGKQNNQAKQRCAEGRVRLSGI